MGNCLKSELIIELPPYHYNVELISSNDLNDKIKLLEEEKNIFHHKILELYDEITKLKKINENINDIIETKKFNITLNDDMKYSLSRMSMCRESYYSNNISFSQIDCTINYIALLKLLKINTSYMIYSAICFYEMSGVYLFALLIRI